MITIKTKEQIESLRRAGKLHDKILKLIAKQVRPNISTLELDKFAQKTVLKHGAKPSFLGYQTTSASYPYPASLCVSVNEEVVHGIPKEDEILKEGDIVSLDLGIEYEGVFTDAAVTVPVGTIDKKLKGLIRHTEKALEIGIKECVVGNKVGDIGNAIERFNNGKYGIVRDFAGHGVGLAVHEEPHIPNWGEKGKGPELKEGMVIALEPMFNLGKDDVRVRKDQYTVITKDKKPSAHFEHTIVITKKGPEVVTRG